LLSVYLLYSRKFFPVKKFNTQTCRGGKNGFQSTSIVRVLHSLKFKLGWRTPLTAIENNREINRVYKYNPRCDIKKRRDLAESDKETGRFPGVYYLFVLSLSG